MKKEILITMMLFCIAIMNLTTTASPDSDNYLFLERNCTYQCDDPVCNIRFYPVCEQLNCGLYIRSLENVDVLISVEGIDAYWPTCEALCRAPSSSDYEEDPYSCFDCFVNTSMCNFTCPPGLQDCFVKCQPLECSMQHDDLATLANCSVPECHLECDLPPLICNSSIINDTDGALFNPSIVNGTSSPDILSNSTTTDSSSSPTMTPTKELSGEFETTLAVLLIIALSCVAIWIIVTFVTSANRRWTSGFVLFTSSSSGNHQQNYGYDDKQYNHHRHHHFT